MGLIKAEGSLLVSRQKTSVHAGCAGSVASYDVPTPKAGAYEKVVMKIICPEIIRLQERFIGLGGNPELADELRTMGMPQWQIDRALFRGTPTKAITLSCLSGHAVTGKLASGSKFKRHAVLFEHGPMVAECEVSNEHAALIKPKASVLVSPMHWGGGQGEHLGHVVDIWASYFGSYAKRVVVAFDCALTEYPAGTEVSVQISLPHHPGEYDTVQALKSARAAAPSLPPVPSYPPRGILRPPAVRQAENRAKDSPLVRGAPQREVVMPLPSSMPDAAKLKLASHLPALSHLVAAEMPRLKLAATTWSNLQLKTVCLADWVQPLYLGLSRIGTFAELGLVPRPLKDSVPIQITADSAPAPFYVRIDVNAQVAEILDASCGQFSATVYLRTGTITLMAKPFGMRVDTQTKRTRLGIELPRSTQAHSSEMPPVEIAGSVESRLWLPSSAVRRGGAGKGRVLAHVGPGTLAVVPLKVGSSVNGYIEIGPGLPVGLAIVAHLEATMKQLQTVLKGTREERRGKALLAGIMQTE